MTDKALFVRHVYIGLRTEQKQAMKENIADILRQAMRLPPEARAALAGSLLDSLDEPVDRDAESAWEAEIASRIREIDEGKATLIPWAKARAKIEGQ